MMEALVLIFVKDIHTAQLKNMKVTKLPSTLNVTTGVTQ